MAADDVGSHNQIAPEQTWQILVELTVPRESGNACSAADRVVEAMQPLNWPAANLERLKLALVKAMWNVMERSRLFGSETSPIIRVLIPGDEEVTQEAGQANDEPNQQQVYKLAIKQVDWPSSHGWGFFLLQKQEEDPQAPAEVSHYVIEVFLYRESKRFRK